MTTLIIDGVEHKINDEVANLVLLISKERDELKQNLTEKSDARATLACSDGLCKTPSIDEGELTPSQYIKSTDIDDEYDNLYVKHQAAIAALKEIGTRLFDVTDFDTVKDAAFSMRGKAIWVLDEIA